MNFTNDKIEIISIIDSIFETPNNDYDVCLNRFTLKINDNFLDNRGKYLRHEILSDLTLKNSFKLLSNICNDKTMMCSNCPVKKYCNSFILNTRLTIPKNSYKIIDLFCGAGGLSLGFKQEGFYIVLANDIEECCIDTYSHNHPEIHRNNVILGDINNIIPQINELVNFQHIDVIVGGPPCQGFSMANRQRLIDDPRNKLYRSYLEIVQKIKPTFFVMENVKGMKSVAKEVQEDFSKIGYVLTYKVLNAKDFGVPQNRERLIYIGNNINIDNELVFKEIELYANKQKNFVLEDALFALRPLKANNKKNSTEIGDLESGYKIEKNIYIKSNEYLNIINSGHKSNIVFNHKARYNNSRDIEIFSRLEQGNKSDDPKIADIMPYQRRNGIFKDKYYKLINNKICKTITAHMKFDCNMYIHPTQARGLTPREAARVQSFPDDYFFRGAYTKTYMQIGNSVPPLLGRAIAHSIKKFLNKGCNNNEF